MRSEGKETERDGKRDRAQIGEIYVYEGPLWKGVIVTDEGEREKESGGRETRKHQVYQLVG